MKRFRKISIVVIAIFAATMIQISSASAQMNNLITKYNSISSLTSKTDVTMNLSASGLSTSEQDNFDMIQPFLDNLRISTVNKYYRSSDNTTENEYMHLMANLGGMPFDTSLWLKSDLSGKAPSMKEIIRVPSMLSEFLPNVDYGKEYGVIDMGNSGGNMSKVGDASEKFTNSIINNLSDIPAGIMSMKDRGTGSLKINGVVTKVHNYTLKLSDTSFKKLLSVSVNNMATNKDIISALKEYLTAADSADDNGAKALSTEIDNGIPNFIKYFNKAMANLNNAKLVGNHGIVINYSLDNNGYIVNANGVVDLVAKAAALNQLMDPADTTKSNGVYNLTIRFNSNTYNINQRNKVVFPYLDSKNSFDMIKALGSINS